MPHCKSLVMKMLSVLMVLKRFFLIFLCPNDTEKPFNLALSRPLKVVLSLSATVKAHTNWHFARCNSDISF